MKKHIVAIILIVFVSFLVNFKLFFPELRLIATPEFELNDAIQLSYASKYWYWEKLHTHELPFWSTEMGAGFPVLGEGQTGILFLPNLILYGLSPSASLAYNLSLVFTIATIAIGTYWWLLLFSVPWAIAIIAGLTFAASGFFLFHLQHIALLQSFSLLPLIFVATHTIMTKHRLRDVLFFAFLFSQQIFSGFMQAVFITGIGSIIYAYFLWKQMKKKKITVFLLMCSFLLGILLAGPQLIPSIEFVKNIQNGAMGNSEYTTQFSFPPKSFLSFLSPFIIGNPKNATYYVNSNDPGLLFWETNGFVGILPLLSIIIILLVKKSWKKIVPLLVLLCISALLMLGKFSPFYFIFDFFPFSLFRVPARFVILVSFTLITIGTIWIPYVNFIKKRWIYFILLACWALNFITIIPYWYSYHDYKTPREITEKPIVVDTIAANSIVYRYDPTWQHRAIYMQYGWKKPQLFTIFQNALRPNTNTFWDITTFDAYSSRILKRKFTAEQLIRTDLFYTYENIATISAETQKFLSLAGISTIISGKLIDSQSVYPLIKTLTDTQSTLYVYQNPFFNNRAYIATTSIPVTTIFDVQKIIQEPSFDPIKSVLVESPNPNMVIDSPTQKDNTLTIIKWTDQDIRIQTTTQVDTVLILQNTYYPGWIATINGEKTPIYPANIASMTIALPKGEHMIRFIYQPTSFLLGCLLMAIGITIPGVYLLLRKHSAFLRKIFLV